MKSVMGKPKTQWEQELGKPHWKWLGMTMIPIRLCQLKGQVEEVKGVKNLMQNRPPGKIPAKEKTQQKQVKQNPPRSQMQTNSQNVQWNQPPRNGNDAQHNQLQINVNDSCFKHRFDMMIKVKPTGEDPSPNQVMSDVVEFLKDLLRTAKAEANDSVTILL